MVLIFFPLGWLVWQPSAWRRPGWCGSSLISSWKSGGSTARTRPRRRKQSARRASLTKEIRRGVSLPGATICIMHPRVLTLSHTLFCSPLASPSSHQAVPPTAWWSVTTKHLRGPGRPKPHRAGSLRDGEKSKRSEQRSSGRVTSCLYNFKIIRLPLLKKQREREKNVDTQKKKRTKKPYVTVPVRWELPSDKVQCCRLPEKFINNCCVDGTSARRAPGWML